MNASHALAPKIGVLVGVALSLSALLPMATVCLGAPIYTNFSDQTNDGGVASNYTNINGSGLNISFVQFFVSLDGDEEPGGYDANALADYGTAPAITFTNNGVLYGNDEYPNGSGGYTGPYTITFSHPVMDISMHISPAFGIGSAQLSAMSITGSLSGVADSANAYMFPSTLNTGNEGQWLLASFPSAATYDTLTFENFQDIELGDLSVTIAATPEPGIGLLLVLGAVFLLRRRPCGAESNPHPCTAK